MLTRRQLALSAFAAAASRAAQSDHGAKPATTVDQNPIRRRGTGLRAFDPSLACPGFRYSEEDVARARATSGVA
jgi:hypothetical protein